MEEIQNDLDELIDDLNKAIELITLIARRYPGDKNITKLATHLGDMVAAATGNHDDEEA